MEAHNHLQADSGSIEVWFWHHKQMTNYPVTTKGATRFQIIRTKTTMALDYELTSYLKDVQANVSVNIHIGVETAGLELDLWRLEGIVVRERKRESVLRPFKDGVFASTDCAFPAEYVVFLGERRYPRITTHLKSVPEKKCESKLY